MGLSQISFVLLGVVVCGFLDNGVTSEKIWPHPMHAGRRYEENRAPRYSPASGPEGQLLSLTREDLSRINRALKKIPIQKGSPFHVVKELAEAVESGDLDWDELVEEAASVDFFEYLMSDKKAQTIITNYRPTYRSVDCEVIRHDDGEDIPEADERDQTQGWDGCFADYDSYIGPFADEFRYETQLRIREDLGLSPGLFPIDPPIEPNGCERNLLDSNGKQPPGVAQGRLHWVGSLEQCNDVIVNHTATMNSTGDAERRIFRGKYARLDMPANLYPLNITSPWPFQMGVCVPDTCSEADIKRYIMEANPTLHFLFTSPIMSFRTRRNITQVYLGQQLHFGTDKPAKAAIGILLGGAIIIIFATCYDGWGRHRVIRKKIKKHVTGSTEGKNEPLTIQELKFAKDYLYEHPSIADRLEFMFAGYSTYTNLKNIFTTRSEHGKYHVPVLDGLRVISFLWLIKGLSYVYGVVYFECWTTDNLLTAIQKYTKEWSFMSILGVYHANTTLFFISGFVCVQMWYKTYDRNDKKVSFMMFIKYILLRWISIMPPIMGMLMLFTCLYRYLGDGPMFPKDISDAEHCRDTWWIVFLFFHNVIRTDEQCFAWTWMFGAVWQLNLVSIVILIPLVLAPIGGYVLLVFMYIAHIVVTVIWNQKVMDGEKSWFFDVLQTPWCNAGPYCIGMMLAMIMRKPKVEWTTKCQKAGIFFLWLMSIAGIFIVVFLPWDKFKGEGKDWPRKGQIAFDVLAPQILGFSLAWITWACSRGYGGVIGDLLNWSAFTTLSKLCLPSAIFMAPTMTSYFYNRLQTFYIHESHMGNLFHGHLIGVAIFGFFTALFFQHPIAKAMKKGDWSRTRLEFFLNCRHPEILDQFTGDAERDKEAWAALDDEAEYTKGDNIALTSVDIMQGKKAVGGYIPHQETGGVRQVVENFSKPPIVNGVQVKANDPAPYQSAKHVIKRPIYDEIVKVPADNQQTTTF